MRRALSRTLTAVAVAAVTAVGTVTAVAPAGAATTAAAPGCSTSIALPARVSIDQPYQEVPVVLRDTCANEYVYALLAGPQGGEDVFEFDPAVDGDVDFWDVDGAFTAPGGYAVLESETSSGTPVARTTSVAKYGSKAALGVTRSRSTVALRACAAAYDGQRDAFRPWRGHRATIEQLSADGRSWRFVRTVTTAADGCATYTLQNKYRETYRVTNWETPAIWGRTSAAVRS